MDPRLWSAKGAFTISTAWTSTTPFKGQSTSYVSSAAINQGAGVTRAIYSGGGGSLAVIMYDGSTGIFPGMPAGGKIEVRAIALSSLNGATSLVGLY